MAQQPETTESKWIPVERQSPEQGQRILIAYRDGEKVHCVSGTFELGFAKYPNGFTPDDRDWAIDAIAWMPLPEFP